MQWDLFYTALPGIFVERAIKGSPHLVGLSHNGTITRPAAYAYFPLNCKALYEDISLARDMFVERERVFRL